MQKDEIQTEIERLKGLFPGADENSIAILDSLIEQAAYERVFLKQLNVEATKTGLVKIHPEHADLQRKLPVSGEIAKHAATLTNIMDKLMKHLGTVAEDDDDGLGDYE